MRNFFVKEQNARYERKFLIESFDITELEQVVKENSFLFSEIFHERKVNNIYLDSCELDSYHHNESGISNRVKYRVRWYGKFFGLIKKPSFTPSIKE